MVNPQLQVHGLSHLRIADASVFPTTISGNTHAACVRVAEKAVALIASR